VIARTLKIVGWLLGWLVALGCSAWALGALHYDFPLWKSAAAWLFGLGLLAAIVFLRGAGKKLGAVFGAFVVVPAWWLTLQPSNERRWQPDVDRTGWAEINGDEVTLHNVRNCDYRTETDYTPSWETRTVRLSQLTQVDLAITYWGSPWIAHPIASFQFADAPPICFSIEARKEIGESYSTIGGFYRQYELIYVMADERDVLRLRTNYRQGEDVFLYRTAMTRANLRERSWSISPHSTSSTSGRAGTTPPRPTARPAFAPSMRPTPARPGIGGYSSTAKSTKCCSNGAPSSPTGSTLPA
jgi:hypothetical protein